MIAPVYLDYNATTPLLSEALESMLPYFQKHFGNPASPHLWGKEALDAVEKARAQIASLFHTSPQEWIFTSGATEALNLALQGLTQAYEGTGKNHLLIAATEHKAVLDPAQALSKRGWIVEILPVTASGIIEPDTLRTALRPTTLLVAIMLANNETGVTQPIQELGALTRQAGVFFLCDTTQAAGKLSFSLDELPVDLAVLSAHKFYGPKGVGALYMRRKQPRVSLKPLLLGGGHEKGLRSGTLPVPLIVGMATALHRVYEKLSSFSSQMTYLKTKLWEGIQSLYPLARLNAKDAPCLPNTLSVTFPGLKASDILARAPLLAAATGAACSSARPEPSHVLLAMGLTPAEAQATLRFSLGLPTTETDIDNALLHLSQAIQQLTPTLKAP
ncbi:MAG: cysteine desulfurase [Bacteroidia bacterium]|nr:cysteine desulfurase [Bacteroidia bacterium]